MKSEYILYGLILAALLVGTYERNHVWRSEISLWQDCVDKSPNKTRPLQNLGFELIASGQPEKASQLFLKAIEMDEKDYVNWYNLAICYYRMKDGERALPAARKAVLLHSDPYTLYQLRITLQAMGKETQ